ncbi:MAG TPA: DinB family protein [Anaerolineales bacterium]|nr:DinB family protein [Anaerolineales bacterium]
MIELLEYRKNLMDRLEAAAQEFQKACLAVKDPFAPLEEGGWNVHQIAAHTRDVDKLVYSMRAHRTLEEENPLFPNFDGEKYMAEHYSSKEPLHDLLDGFVSNVESLVKVLRDLSGDKWSRESRHETQGAGLTLQHWVERSLAHMEEHLATVKRAK